MIMNVAGLSCGQCLWKQVNWKECNEACLSYGVSIKSVSNLSGKKYVAVASDSRRMFITDC